MGTHWTKGAGAEAQIERLAPLAAPFLCDMASGSRKTRGELARHDALDAYLSIARNKPGASSPPGLQLAAVEAIAGWMRDEPWKVEARLMEDDAVAAVSAAIDPRRTPPPSPEVLDRLREIARESPRLCAALASGGRDGAAGGGARRSVVVHRDGQTHTPRTTRGTVDWTGGKVTQAVERAEAERERRGGDREDPARAARSEEGPQRARWRTSGCWRS